MRSAKYTGHFEETPSLSLSDKPNTIEEIVDGAKIVLHVFNPEKQDVFRSTSREGLVAGSAVELLKVQRRPVFPKSAGVRRRVPPESRANRSAPG
jgi:hypothetical protein